MKLVLKHFYYKLFLLLILGLAVFYNSIVSAQSIHYISVYYNGRELNNLSQITINNDNPNRTLTFKAANKSSLSSLEIWQIKGSNHLREKLVLKGTETGTFEIPYFSESGYYGFRFETSNFADFDFDGRTSTFELTVKCTDFSNADYGVDVKYNDKKIYNNVSANEGDKLELKAYSNIGIKQFAYKWEEDASYTIVKSASSPVVLNCSKTIRIPNIDKNNGTLLYVMIEPTGGWPTKTDKYKITLPRDEDYSVPTKVDISLQLNKHRLDDNKNMLDENTPFYANKGTVLTIKGIATGNARISNGYYQNILVKRVTYRWNNGEELEISDQNRTNAEIYSLGNTLTAYINVPQINNSAKLKISVEATDGTYDSKTYIVMQKPPTELDMNLMVDGKIIEENAEVEINKDTKMLIEAISNADNCGIAYKWDGEQWISKTSKHSLIEVPEYFWYMDDGLELTVKVEATLTDKQQVEKSYVIKNENFANKPVQKNSTEYNYEDEYEYSQSRPSTTANSTIWSSASAWAIDELEEANEKGIIPKIFDKEDLTKNITRREFAHIAVKLYENISKKYATIDYNPFIDTDDVEILKAYNLSITKGTSENTFEPDKEITREEMATMIARAISAAGIQGSARLDGKVYFADDKDISSWARASVYYLYEKNIIKGVGNNMFDCQGNATREAALLISLRCVKEYTNN